MINDNGMTIRISTEGVMRAADELTQCGKSLRYSSAELASDIEELKAEEHAGDAGTGEYGADGDISEEILQLERQQRELEVRIRDVDIMVNILERLSDEAEMTEDIIRDHADEIGAGMSEAGVSDLSGTAEMIDKVLGNK